MPADGTEDPLRSMIVDRVARDDGRYLLYYRWPPPEDAADDEPDAGDDGPVEHV